MADAVAELVRRVRRRHDALLDEKSIEYCQLADAYERLADAALRVLDWYDRDGSVGGACDPMEALRAALSAHTEENR